MQIKANLHLHTRDDVEDKPHKNIIAKYTLFEAIQKAKEKNINILAATCHNFVYTEEEYYDYAKKLGILLIPGIEKTIEKKHVLIINLPKNKEIEKIKTFEELKKYKERNPKIFIIAPHPFYRTSYSLGTKLLKNIEVFDAIEHSWFYFKFFNPNKKAQKISQKFNLPLIATSDTHNLNMLDKSYIIADIKELSFEALKEALIKGHYRNFSSPPKFFSWDTWNWLKPVEKIQKLLL